MTELQACQLSILKYFHDFCVAHNLRYFLCGGTALGAIRHKGFIPWDDDIDLFMPRSDYEKLYELADKLINIPNGKYFLQSYKSDPNYLYNFMKLRDNDTVFVESIFKYNNINHGVWIDIFPLDGLSNDIKVAKRYVKRFHHTWYRVWLSYLKTAIRHVRLRSLFKDVGMNILGYLFYFYNHNNCQNKKIDKICMKYSYDESRYVSSAQDIIKCKIFEKSLFDEVILMPFEGEMFYVPKRYDEYLTQAYGDYMTPPPVEQQIPHHFTAYENLHLSWRTFKKDYKKW